ncbi:hypothetical protein BG006_006949 [Podila minutissima]|uniref:ADP-ribosylation factor n=1 Tax=Podila minutissima TaxID=64525 RepID=A0A9P5SMA7_9FUNG|nr:hypothetical protein BG006_006949 [Podila minutissima]
MAAVHRRLSSHEIMPHYKGPSAPKDQPVVQAQAQEIVTGIPIVCLNVKTVVYKNIPFKIWDIDGDDKTRPLWRNYMDSIAVVSVVDSSDRDQISEFMDELRRLNNEDEFNDAVFLFFANKHDMPGYMTKMELYETLELKELAAT